MNIRRIPGFIYHRKYLAGSFFFTLIFIIYLLYHWGIICTNLKARRQVSELVSTVFYNNNCLHTSNHHFSFYEYNKQKVRWIKNKSARALLLSPWSARSLTYYSFNLNILCTYILLIYLLFSFLSVLITKMVWPWEFCVNHYVQNRAFILLLAKIFILVKTLFFQLTGKLQGLFLKLPSISIQNYLIKFIICYALGERFNFFLNNLHKILMFKL